MAIMPLGVLAARRADKPRMVKALCKKLVLDLDRKVRRRREPARCHSGASALAPLLQLR
jgi:hypothetical protein